MRNLRCSMFWCLCLLFLFQCTDTPTTKVDFTGKYIDKIVSDSIFFEDGSVLDVSSDSLQKVFYLIRHAEKDTLPTKADPFLTDAGNARANKLAQLLKGTRIDGIYSTMYLRTLYTVSTIAEIKAMSVLPYDNKKLRPTIDTLLNHTEANRILIVGHSNSIPSLANSLYGHDYFRSNFDETDYDNFVIVVKYAQGANALYSLRYRQ